MCGDEAPILEMHEESQERIEQTAGGDSAPAVEGKGFGVRAGALALDGILLSVMGVVVIPIGLLLLGRPPLAGVIYAARVRQDSSLQNLYIGLIVELMYFTLCEWLYGATPAKLLLRLRVVKVGGQRCGLVSALVRSVLRPVDVLYWGIAALVNGFSHGLPVLRFMTAPLCQRIGDEAAGTVVAGWREPWLQQRRPWGWLPVALGLSFLIAIGLQVGFMQYVDRDSAPGDVYVAQAATAHATKDYARAAELWEQAIAAGMPQDRLPNVYFLLGNEYYLLGEVDRAIQTQKQALEIDPGFYPAWQSQGTAYWSVDDSAQARVCYERVVALAPDEPQGYLNLGWLAIEKGNPEQAMRFLEQVLQIDPEQATAHAYMALAFALQGRFADAKDSLRIARESGYADWQIVQEQIERLEESWQ